MYSPKLSIGLKQVKGGKTLKQGDHATELIYIFVDEDGSPINLGGGSVNVSLLNEETNTRVYTKSVTSDGSSITLTMDKALPTATYDIEMTLNGHKVPSNRYESQLTITANHDNALVDEIEVYGIDKLKQEIIQSISGGTINLDGFLKAVDANKLYAPVNHSHSEYALSSVLANYALKEHTHDEYALKEHTHDNYVTQEQLAQASLGGEVDLSGYVSKTELADKGYLTSIPDEYVTETELSEKGYLTVETFTQTQADKLYQPKGNYATKEELADVSSGGSVDLSNYVTKDVANSTYQPKGNYATKEDLASISTGGSIDLSDYVKTSDLDNYASKDDLQGYLSNETLEQTLQSKGYLTSIPDEYITESELEQKGYLKVIGSTEQPQETGVLLINPDGTVDVGEAYDDSKVWEEIDVLKAKTSSMATKIYVDGKLGDIESALSAILGGA